MTQDVTARPAAPPSSGAPRGTWWLRDRPGIFWLVAAAVVALGHFFIPESVWLMIHMIALGAMSHSVMVWSTHFATTLLKSSPEIDPRAQQGRRLVMLQVGTVLVLVGVPTAWWWLTALGASLVAVAVGWHGVALCRRLRSGLPGRFRIAVRFYLAAAACLPVGALLGTLLARGPGEEMHARLVVAHSLTNVLGWLALTVVGTIITLWPTMLRAPMDPRSEQRAATALPMMALGLAVAVLASLVGERPLAAAGLLVYLAGVVWSATSMIAPARRRPPMHVGPWSVAAGLVWLVVGTLAVLWRLLTADSWAAAGEGYGHVALIFVAGFMLQVLTGALSHLVPAILGGGPSVVRAGMEVFDRWGAARVVIINLGLALWLLPVPSGVRVVLSLVGLATFVAFVPLLFLAIRRCVAARRASVELLTQGPPTRESLEERRAEIDRLLNPPFPTRQVVVGLAVVALAVAAGPLAQPLLDGGVGTGVAPTAAVAPTGVTRQVAVVARADMTFSPDRVEVDAGDRVVITLSNEDGATAHDLVFDGETRTERLLEGDSGSVDLGVVGAERRGFCSVTGHKLMGMTFTVVVTDAPVAVAAPGAAASPGAASADRTSDTSPFALDPKGRWSDDFTPVDAALPDLDDRTTHRVTLTVRETTAEVAPGVRATRWTFDDGSGPVQAPGPVLHGRVGDRFVVTLVNDGSMGHSIDFHAGELAPDRPMRTIAPGERLTYTFTAERAGAWMYHCSTMPMSTHISAGMHGAVIIEPRDLPEVDRSYALVASEAHLGAKGEDGTYAIDAEAAGADRPSLFTFNGAAFQYDEAPLTARVGERVRVWVVAAGPSRSTSFHVVGGQFDTTWTEGRYTLGRPDETGSGDGGAQVLPLLPAQGGFVELAFPEAGHYPFVSHVMADAERGAHGTFEVTD